ncbi:hypothetical protein KXQ82_18165 [Mucilaginibacter sp. HMF5004]|uniref:hypothetical protein n=1 Tax=Mucilaginibacter rivuli TaxID=2857527 RepID=UPI001C5DA309|nr:hypothetical protein [Mucilaginibacter rivuli]MBW4891657.1 hypothetical protein [Mucilaginibacter rivuli]
MKKILWLNVLIVLVLFTACNNHLYEPALYKTDINYQFKPMAADSIKSANSISAKLKVSGGTNANDAITIGEVAYSRANTFKHFNIAYGGYGFLGEYYNNSIKENEPGYFDFKYFSGFGLHFSANAYFTEGRIDYRFIGFEAAFSKEFGSYPDFRKSIKNTPNFYTDASTSLFTGGLTTEIIWHRENDQAIKYGYRLFLGTVFGSHEFTNLASSGSAYSSIVNTGRMCYAGALFAQVDQLQIVFQVQNLSGITFGLGYSF